jgi:hypothetical protein
MCCNRGFDGIFTSNVRGMQVPLNAAKQKKRRKSAGSPGKAPKIGVQGKKLKSRGPTHA